MVKENIFLCKTQTSKNKKENSAKLEKNTLIWHIFISLFIILLSDPYSHFLNLPLFFLIHFSYENTLRSHPDDVFVLQMKIFRYIFLFFVINNNKERQISKYKNIYIKRKHQWKRMVFCKCLFIFFTIFLHIYKATKRDLKEIC